MRREATHGMGGGGSGGVRWRVKEYTYSTLPLRFLKDPKGVFPFGLCAQFARQHGVKWAIFIEVTSHRNRKLVINYPSITRCEASRDSGTPRGFGCFH